MLTGKVALVTGASSGIGEGIALALAEAGADVAVSARRVDRLAALVERMNGRGVRAVAIPCDVAVEAEATAAVEQTIAQLGRLDILVNSAGIIQAGGIESCSLDEYRRLIDVNLMGTVYSCKAAIGPMKGQGSGDIINISSQAGRKPAAPFNAYSASKFAVNGMTESLRQEVGTAGIRVTTLMPGAVRSEVAEAMSDPTFREAMKAHVGREGTCDPSDIGDAVVFICGLPRRANIDMISIRPTIDVSG
jgi:NADP-dependent 3-hydroxy acid dehydrogenase YdfG